MAQLKLERTTYKLGSYSLVKDLQPCEYRIAADQSQSTLNLFTQALFRTAKRIDVPFVTANMVGKPYFVVTFRTLGLLNGQSRAMINPQLVWCSDESQFVEETFIYNKGESVIKERPQKIKVAYMNKKKQVKVFTFTGRFAAYVLQAIEVMHGVPLIFIPPTPSEVAARLQKIHGDKYASES